MECLLKRSPFLKETVISKCVLKTVSFYHEKIFMSKECVLRSHFVLSKITRERSEVANLSSSGFNSKRVCLKKQISSQRSVS